MVFDIGIRFIIVLTTLFLILYENIDYKIPFLVLNIFYISLIFLFFSLRKGKYSKFIILAIDTIFISIFAYLTSYPELTLFIFPFSVSFLDEKKSVIIFSLFSLISVSVGFYISGFSEVIFIPFYIAFIVAISGFYIRLGKEKRIINNIRENLETLYKDNLKLQDSNEHMKNYKSTVFLSMLLNEGKIDLNSYLFSIYEFLSCKGIIFYNFLEKRCISIGQIECEKDLPKYLSPGFSILENTKVNKMLNVDVAVSVSLDTRDGVYGFVIFCYDVFDEKDVDFIKISSICLKSYLS